MTEMLLWHLQKAWEDLQVANEQFLSPPYSLPPVTHVANGITIVRGPLGAPPKNPIGKQKPKKSRDPAEKELRRYAKTKKGRKPFSA